MSRMKKFVSIVLAGAMTFALSVSAFAATPGITSYEQKILDEAKAKAEELGVLGTKTYNEYVSQASTYLERNELSNDQVDAMVKAVDQAAQTTANELKTKGVSSVKDLSAADLQALFNKVGDEVVVAAEKVGIKIKQVNGEFVAEDLGTTTTTNTNTGDSTNGTTRTDVVIDSAKVIKQTGAELTVDGIDTAAASVDTAALGMTGTVAMVVMFVGAVVVCGVVAKKKDLFSSAEA